jgi:hypothetical protein
MKHLSKILPLALVLPGLVAAQCPVAADLETGIVLETIEGEVETFIRLDPHRVRSLFMHSENAGSRILLGKGVYVLELLEEEDGLPMVGTRTTYSFPLPVADLPPITPGGGWSTKAAVLDVDGLSSEAQHYIFGAQTRVTIGACSYDMIPIELRYRGDAGDADIDYLHYLPELGISYLARSDYGAQSDIYTYHTIRVAP